MPVDFGPVIFFLILFGGVLLVIFGVIAAHKAEQKRIAELSAWADTHGFSFSPAKRHKTSYPPSIFKRGHSRYSRYHMVADIPDATPGLDAPAHIELFEYHFAITTSNGKSSTTTHYYHTCCAAYLGIDFGEIEIREERFTDRIAAVFGWGSINFEDAEFSRRFLVKSPDRRRTYAIIGPSMIRFLMQHRGFHIETYGDLLFIHFSGRVSIDQFERLRTLATGIAAQIPRVVVNDARARRGLPPKTEAGDAASSSRNMFMQLQSGGYA